MTTVLAMLFAVLLAVFLGIYLVDARQALSAERYRACVAERNVQLLLGHPVEHCQR